MEPIGPQDIGGGDFGFDDLLSFDFDICDAMIPEAFRARPSIASDVDQLLPTSSGSTLFPGRPRRRQPPIPPHAIYRPGQFLGGLSDGSGIDEESAGVEVPQAVSHADSSRFDVSLFDPIVDDEVEGEIPSHVVSLRDLHPNARLGVLRRMEAKAFGLASSRETEGLKFDEEDESLPHLDVPSEDDSGFWGLLSPSRSSNAREETLLRMLPVTMQSPPSSVIVGSKRRRRQFPQPLRHFFQAEGRRFPLPPDGMGFPINSPPSESESSYGSRGSPQSDWDDVAPVVEDVDAKSVCPPSKRRRRNHDPIEPPLSALREYDSSFMNVDLGAPSPAFPPFDGLEFPSMEMIDRVPPIFSSSPEITTLEVSASGGARSLYVKPIKYDLYLRKNKMVQIVMQYCDLGNPSPSSVLVSSFEQIGEDVITVELVRVERRTDSGWIDIGDAADISSLVEPSKKGFLSLELSEEQGRFRVVLTMKIHKQLRTGGSVPLRFTFRLTRGFRMWNVFYVLCGLLFQAHFSPQVFTVDSGSHNAKKLSLKKVCTTVSSSRRIVGPLKGEMFQYSVMDQESFRPVGPFDLMSYSHFTPKSMLIGQMAFCCGGGLGEPSSIPFHRMDDQDFWSAFGLTKRNWGELSNLIPNPKRRRTVVWVMGCGYNPNLPPFSEVSRKIRLLQTSPSLRFQDKQQDLAVEISELFDGLAMVFHDLTNGSSPNIEQLDFGFRYLRQFARSNHSVNVIAVCPWQYTLPECCPILEAAIRALPKTVLMSCAAGNRGQNLESGKNWIYPICCSAPSPDFSPSDCCILTVGAFDVHGKSVRVDSNFGELVSLFAPASSTSYASVYAGLMASLVWCVKPSLASCGVGDVLLRASSPIVGVIDAKVLTCLGQALTELIRVRMGIDRDLADLGSVLEGSGPSANDLVSLEDGTQMLVLLTSRQVRPFSGGSGTNAPTLSLKEVASLKTSKLVSRYFLVENEIACIRDHQPIVSQLTRQSSISAFRSATGDHCSEGPRIQCIPAAFSDKGEERRIRAIENQDILSYSLRTILSDGVVARGYDDAFVLFWATLTECFLFEFDVQLADDADETRSSSFLAAWRLAFHGKFDAAASCFGSIVTEDHSAFALSCLLSEGLFLSSGGNSEGSLSVYTRALPFLWSSLPLVFSGLIHEIALGDFEECLRLYAIALERDPVSLVGLLARGNCYYFRLQQYERAESDYETALAVCRDHPFLVSNFSVLLFSWRRDKKRAFELVSSVLRVVNHTGLHWNRAVYGLAMGRIEESRQSCDEVSDQGSAVPNLQAVLLAFAGKVDDAVELLDRSLQSESMSDSARAEMFNTLGVFAFSEKLFSEALRHFNVAVRTDPSCSEIHCNRGFALLKLRRCREALTAFAVALDLNPFNYLAYKGRGVCFLKSRVSHEAFMDLNCALQIESSDDSLLFLRGVALISLDPRSALVDFDRYLSVRPDCPRGHFYRAVATSLAGCPNLPKMQADLDRAIELDPKFALALNNRGFISTKLLRLEDARKDLDQAIAHRPNYANALFNRANLYADYLDDFEQALLDFNKAIELNPNTALPYLTRGRLHHAMGRDDLSEKDMAKFANLMSSTRV